MSTKRIAFFTLNYAPETTGIAPYSTGLAEGLVERGAHVRVFTGFPHYPEWKRRNGVASNQTINGVSVQRLEHRFPHVRGRRTAWSWRRSLRCAVCGRASTGRIC